MLTRLICTASLSKDIDCAVFICGVLAPWLHFMWTPKVWKFPLLQETPTFDFYFRELKSNKTLGQLAASRSPPSFFVPPVADQSASAHTDLCVLMWHLLSAGRSWRATALPLTPILLETPLDSGLPSLSFTGSTCRTESPRTNIYNRLPVSPTRADAFLRWPVSRRLKGMVSQILGCNASRFICHQVLPGLTFRENCDSCFGRLLVLWLLILHFLDSVFYFVSFIRLQHLHVFSSENQLTWVLHTDVRGGHLW